MIASTIASKSVVETCVEASSEVTRKGQELYVLSDLQDLELGQYSLIRLGKCGARVPTVAETRMTIFANITAGYSCSADVR